MSKNTSYGRTLNERKGERWAGKRPPESEEVDCVFKFKYTIFDMH
jgi:hypothetical protein